MAARAPQYVHQIQWNNAITPLRRSRSFKIIDFGTNRKPIYDFLLVINTNLRPILHRFQVIWFVKFSLARGECLTLTLSRGVIPFQYRHKWYIAKNYISWSIFLPPKVSMHLQPLLRNPPRKLPNCGEIKQPLGLLRRSRSFKVTDFGINRKLICDFLLVINTNLAP